MKISTCTNKHFLRKIEVFIIFWQFLNVIHTKSQNFLKISMFSNVFENRHVFEISHKISIFFPKKLTVLHKNWCWEKHSLLYPKVLHLRIFANFRVKLKNLWFHLCLFKKLQFFFYLFFNKDYTFYTRNLFLQQKTPKVSPKSSF